MLSLREMMAELDLDARFPKGIPADPTINMDPEDAKVWREMNEKYKDVVKEKAKEMAKKKTKKKARYVAARLLRLEGRAAERLLQDYVRETGSLAGRMLLAEVRNLSREGFPTRSRLASRRSPDTTLHRCMAAVSEVRRELRRA